MIRLSRISIILLGVIVMAVYVPDLFWKAFEKKVSRPFILYSAPLDEFVWRLSDKFKEAEYRDESGRTYDRIGYEKVLPFTYYRDLLKWGELPEEVRGVKIDHDVIRENYQHLRITADALHTPQIELYPLFESRSMFSRIEYPAELFRITSRMEFIDASTNRIDEELSAAFTAALREEGFVFPAGLIAGNATDRKPFDEGYFVTDARGSLFHIKLVEGKPWCLCTGLTSASGVRYITVRENPRKEFYGMLIAGDGKIHLLSYDDYALIPLPVPGYDPDRMTIQMFADPINRTFIYSDSEEDVIHCVATDRNYEVVRTFECTIPTDTNSGVETLSRLLFPFHIATSNPKTDYVLFDVEIGDPLALIGIAISLLILAAVRVRRRAPFHSCWIDFVLVALTGVFGLAAVLVVGREPQRN